jgi:hypothetical protein
MTVFPARRAVPLAPRRALPPARSEPTNASIALDAVRPHPLEWARRRRAEREARRIEAAGARAISHLDHLGPAWHLVEWPRTDHADRWFDADAGVVHERAGFLAIGPSGLFAVTIADHGRSRVMIAGDVVQINGRRPGYVAEARRDAKRAAKALSDAVGLTVPVTPVLTFVGSGVISVYGLPKDCLVATHRELDRLLIAGGRRISAATAEKLSQVARHPATWLSHNAASYRWYGEGVTVTSRRQGVTHR